MNQDGVAEMNSNMDVGNPANMLDGAAGMPVPQRGEPGYKAKRIVVSLLGRRAPDRTDLAGDAALDYMKAYWKKEFDQVLANKPDLIVMPEASDRYPGLPPEKLREWYRFRGNKMRDFLAEIARQNHCYIAYAGARLLPDGSCRNSIQLIDRSGNIAGIYNKNHPVPSETFRMGILCGKDAPVFETDFGRVAMAICFDLNFHELLEKYAVQRPDLILFSSLYHGGIMQNYWAYHCRSYFVSAFPDECTVVNPLGETVARSSNYSKLLTAPVNLDNVVVHLDENWEKLSSLKHKYGRSVTIQDPGFLGAVLVTSEHPDITAREMIAEFGIATWDDYYARCLKHRHTPEYMEP